VTATARPAWPRGLLRPTVAWVDLDRLLANFDVARATAAGRPVLAVVKADAYGHGAVQVGRALRRHGADKLGVATVEEGLELRDGGVRGAILVFGGTHGRAAADAIVAGRLTPAVWDAKAVRDLDRAAVRARRRVEVHLKVDTGMSRLGARWDEMSAVTSALGQARRLRVGGLFTVLASGDDQKRTPLQLERLQQARRQAEAAGLGRLLLHAANSAALGHGREARLDLVRPGLALYGLGGSDRRLRVRPCLRLEAQIVRLLWLPRGAEVGYSGSFRCRRRTLAATIPLGYADGLPRHLSNRGEVLVRGRRAPIVGAVSMDLTVLDVTDVAGVQPSDRVTLLGEDGDDEITAAEVADRSGTIAWEVLCRLGARVARVYRRSGRTVAVVEPRRR